MKETQKGIKEIRVFQLENEEIEEVFERDWLFSHKVFLFFDAKSIKPQELSFLNLYQNIEINPL